MGVEEDRLGFSWVIKSVRHVSEGFCKRGCEGRLEGFFIILDTYWMAFAREGAEGFCVGQEIF